MGRPGRRGQHTDTADAVDRLREVDVPALVLWGAEDTWLPPETGDRLAAFLA
jgi:pimeloyl-ACP methyl ester carboxylesterase